MVPKGGRRSLGVLRVAHLAGQVASEVPHLEARPRLPVARQRVEAGLRLGVRAVDQVQQQALAQE
jgi:flagellar biosynthesis/type III secretory pathway ATPase